MDQRILEFIGDLRRAEMRISPSEALDALTASTEIGLEDRETFKSALATTWSRNRATSSRSTASSISTSSTCRRSGKASRRRWARRIRRSRRCSTG